MITLVTLENDIFFKTIDFRTGLDLQKTEMILESSHVPHNQFLLLLTFYIGMVHVLKLAS